MRHARPLRRGGTAPPRDRRHGVTARATTPTSQHLALAIRTASIDTRNAKRDAHLRNNAFFDVDTYPEILFVSTAVEQTSAARYRVTGDLTIKDVTKPVPSTSSTPAPPPTRPATTGSASKATPPSTAWTGASAGTPPSRAAACSSAGR
jgi:hypothetical protein